MSVDNLQPFLFRVLLIFRQVRIHSKRACYMHHVVSPRQSAWFPWDRLSWNLVLETH